MVRFASLSDQQPRCHYILNIGAIPDKFPITSDNLPIFARKDWHFCRRQKKQNFGPQPFFFFFGPKGGKDYQMHEGGGFPHSQAPNSRLRDHSCSNNSAFTVPQCYHLKQNPSVTAWSKQGTITASTQSSVVIGPDAQASGFFPEPIMIS